MKFKKIKNLKIYLSLARFDKLSGFFLLLWPIYWALLLSNDRKINFYFFLIFTIGAILMRSAGCIINDIIDKKIDMKISRTKKRPLANKKISSKRAILLFFVLVFFSFLLILKSNSLVFYLSVVTFFLICFYPFTKRITHFPQVVLGVTFGMSIFIVYAFTKNFLPLESWLLFFIVVIWSIIYDTEYSMIDREEDIKIGVKSTAIIFKKFDKFIIFILQLVMLLSLFCMGKLFKLSNFYFFSLIFIFVLFLYQQSLIKDRHPDLCLKAFKSNNYIGLILLISIV